MRLALMLLFMLLLMVFLKHLMMMMLVLMLIMILMLSPSILQEMLKSILVVEPVMISNEKWLHMKSPELIT